MSVSPQSQRESSRPRDAGSETGSTTRRLGHLLQPYTGRLFLVLGLMFVLTAINVARPWLMGVLIDDVLIAHRWAVLWLVLAGFVAMYIGRNLLYFQSKYNSVKVGENIAFTLRKRLFERLQQMSVRYYKQAGAGQISSRVMNDSFVIQSFIQDELPTLLQSTLMLLCLIAALFWQDGVLAVAATVVLPLHLLTAKLFRGPIKRSSREAQQQIGEVQGNLIEKFFGVEVVKGFGAEDRENERFTSAIDLSRRWQLKSKRFHVWQKVVADVLVGVGTVLLIGLGAARVVWGHMQPGEFIAFLGWVMMLYPEILSLMSGFAKLTKSSASMDRVFELLETYEEESSRPGRARREPIRGDVAFERVAFAYHPESPVLRGVSFSVPAGTFCVVCGPSGGGKSTLVNMLPRFQDPDHGRVTVDGIDVRDFDLRHLRAAIGIAFQETFLFNSTVMENLRYARPDATDQQIRKAARQTRADAFIERLPRGYETVLGGEGVTLSRGESQRLTLTRAILKDPQILILDEATASLDAASQRQIIPAIREFTRGKTTLMITHNEELIAQADTVIRLAEGRVVYQGPPQRAALRSEASPWHEGQKGLTMWLAAAVVGLSAMLGGGQAMAQDAQEAPPPAKAEAKPAPAASNAAPDSAPKTTAQLVPQPGLNQIEVEDLIDLAVSHARAAMGYEPFERGGDVSLPDPPEGLMGQRTLARREGGTVRLLRLGYRMFRSQPPHVYVVGQSVPAGDAGGAIAGNPEVNAVAKRLTESRKTLEQQYAAVEVGDLEARKITLSYIEADRCLGLLKSLGYQVIEHKSAKGVGRHEIISPTGQVDVKKLPAILEIPASSAIDLVGEGDDRRLRGEFGLAITPSIATNLPTHTAAAPTLDILVLYHPARPEQFSRVLERIRTTIDVPARQILIEAMVLEITDGGLRDLGVEWDLETPAPTELSNLDTLTLGRIPDLDVSDTTLDIEASNIFGEFSVRLRALVDEGEAEILSRPSVLTLDNRQASIRVGEEIPVATSATGVRGGDKITFDFKYIPVGILLNVRPRIDADGRDVSMQIDGIVSAVVPGEDLVIRDNSDNELARAPQVSTRRVQTYSRIANNTPFIIGGLISRDDTNEIQKTPLLGDVPVLGKLFSRERSTRLKREVIIVITPYVLSDQRIVGRNIPKDDDAFDSFGNQLFRDAYRIRSGDVFDLAFITDNPQLVRLKQFAERAALRDFRLATQYPFNRFVGRAVPGERILVYRQMYEVIKRLGLSDRVEFENLIFFKPDPATTSGFSVGFLHRTMLGFAEEHEVKAHRRLNLFGPNRYDPQAYFAGLEGEALAITYTLPGGTGGGGVRDVLDQPVPEIRRVPCADRDAWGRLLWELNQPDENGRVRRTILLHEPDDLVRLRRSLLLKRVVQLNANRQTLTLNNFTVGRQLLMPTIKPGKIFVVDDEAAKYFFYTEQYYAAVERELNRDVVELRDVLKRPDIARYFDESLPINDTPIEFDGPR